MKLSNSFFYTIRENAKDEDSTKWKSACAFRNDQKSSAGIYMIMPMGKEFYKRLKILYVKKWMQQVHRNY